MMFYKVYFEIVLGFGVDVVLEIDQINVFLEVVTSFFITWSLCYRDFFFNDGPSKSILR